MEPTEPLIVADAAAWRTWLDENEDTSDFVWLLLAKKGTTSPTSLSYREALEEALCSGWIDGQNKSRDQATYVQRFGPRRRRSIWSKINVERIATLREQGRMRPRGEAEVAAAQADGRWAAAYAGPATMEPSPELLAALASHPAARAVFDGLDAQNRYAVLHRLATLKTDAGRRRAIARTVDRLAAGELPYPSAGKA